MTKKIRKAYNKAVKETYGKKTKENKTTAGLSGHAMSVGARQAKNIKAGETPKRSLASGSITAAVGSGVAREAKKSNKKINSNFEKHFKS